MNELELEAVVLFKKYRFMLPWQVKAFLLRLAIRLEWRNLESEMK